MALAVVPEAGGAGDGSPEQRLAVLMGLANTVAAEIVAVIAEALVSGAWEGAGIRSPEHWVTWRCGVSPGRARRLVVAARRLGVLPVTAAAFAEGSLSEDQVAVIAAHTEPEHDAEVAELARYAMVPQLCRALRSLPEVLVAERVTPGPQRQVSFQYGDDGWWRLRAVLPAEEGAVVQASLEAARAAEFADRHPGADPDDVGGRGGVGWADGLARQAALALDGLEAGARGRPGTRVQVLVHVNADREGAPAHLHLGPALPAVVRRHLGCDAALTAVIERGGVPVAVGRRRRTVDHRLRTLIEDRDRGCRVPGCAQTRWLHVHHLVHWEDGGTTDPGNLLALCPAHHRAHHHGEIGIAGDPDRPDGLVFTNHWGGGVLNRPPPPPPQGPPPQAARHLGLPPPRWQPPTGEQLHGHWLTWSEPPRAAS